LEELVNDDSPKVSVTMASTSSSKPPQPPIPCPCHVLVGGSPSSSPDPTSARSGSKGQRNTPLNPLCPSCVSLELQPHWEKRSEARKRHLEMKRWCGERLHELRRDGGHDEDANGNVDGSCPNNDKAERGKDTLTSTSTSGSNIGISGTSLSRLKHQSDQRRAQLDQLRLVCGDRSVKVASLALRNDERQQRLLEERQRIEAARLGLDAIWVGVLGGADDDDAEEEFDNTNKRGSGKDGTTKHESSCRSDQDYVAQDGLPGAVSLLASEAKSRRLDLALCAFDAHRIDIGPDCSNAVDGKDKREENNSEKTEEEQDDEDETGAKARAAARAERMRRRPRGVGKVCGLPLPHAGPALYGVLPPAVLASSLRLAASLTVMISRCLGIALPHPILLRPLGIASIGDSRSNSSRRSKARIAAARSNAQRKQCGDIAETVSVSKTSLEDLLMLSTDDNRTELNTIKSGPRLAGNGSGNAPTSASQSLLSSASSIRTFGRTARWALAMATGNSSSEAVPPVSASHSTKALSNVSTETPPSYSNLSSATKHDSPIDKSTLAARIRHAAAAVIWEGGDGTGGEYALIPPGWAGAPVRSSASSLPDGLSPDDEFATGLQLLQNDVIALCIRAGVQISDMWPAEALLLNLDLLRIHLQKEHADEQGT